MRAATLFVAVLCATLPAVHGRERLKTSEDDWPWPHPGDTDDTEPETPEDPIAAGPIKPAWSLCRRHHQESDLPEGWRSFCSINFMKQEDGRCRTVTQEMREPKTTEVSSTKAVCDRDSVRGDDGAVCSCSTTGCSANTFYEALANFMGPEKPPWLHKCRESLDQLERAANVENEQNPMTGQPKQDKTTAQPPKPTSTPKDVSNAKTTSAAPSAPDPTPTDPSNQESKRCSGKLAYQKGVTGNNGPFYCAYEFTKDGEKSCSAVPQERFVKKKNEDLSKPGDTSCANVKETIICLCEGLDCNNNTKAISNKLKEFLGSEAMEWKKDCLQQLDKIEGKDREGAEEIPEEGTTTEPPTVVMPQTDTESTTAETKTGPESTTTDGKEINIDGQEPSSSTPSNEPNQIIVATSGDTVGTTDSTTASPTTTTSEGDSQADTTQFDATTSESPDESTGQDDPTTQLPETTETTTEDPDGVPPDVKSTTVTPVETNIETTTGTSEAATTSTSQTSTKEPETTTQTAAENEKDTTTTPGSGITEPEASNTMETTIGQAGNGEPIHNQESQGGRSDNQGMKVDTAGGGLPGWLIALLVFLALLAVCLIIGGFILTRKKKEDKVEDVEGGQKTAPAAPEPPAQPAPVVKPVQSTGPVVLAKMAPLPPKQPTVREQIMKEQWEKQLELNAALDAAKKANAALDAVKKAPAVPAVPEVVPPKKEEEKAAMGGQVQVVDEQLPVLPTQEDNSLKEAPKVEAVKAETSWKEKATQGTVDSVKTQASESHKSEKKKSSPPKELPKNDVV